MVEATATDETNEPDPKTDEDKSYLSAGPRNLGDELDQEERARELKEGVLFELDNLPPTERDARRTSQHFDEIDDARKQLLATPKQSIPPRNVPSKTSAAIKQIVIGGRKITAHANKTAARVTAPRLWDKERRSTLSAEERATFYEKAIRAQEQ